MRHLPGHHAAQPGLQAIEADEIWAFCYAKQKNVPEDFEGTPGYGDVWTWTAIDADTKLVPSWLVGERTLADAYAFISDLHSRLKGRVQMTTDGLKPYLDVVDALMPRQGGLRGAPQALRHPDRWCP